MIDTGNVLFDWAYYQFWKWLWAVVLFGMYYDAKKRISRYKAGVPIL